MPLSGYCSRIRCLHVPNSQNSNKSSNKLTNLALVFCCFCCYACSPHYYQQMAKEADKQWPSKNKKLDWMLALAHGT